MLYIVGFNYDIDYWHFNLPFIMKYQPIFDLENKIIAFYNDLNLFNESDFTQEPNSNINNNEKNQRGAGYYVKVIFIIFLILFLIITIFVLVRKALFNYKQKMQKDYNESQFLEFKDMSDHNEDSKDNKNDTKSKLNI